MKELRIIHDTVKSEWYIAEVTRNERNVTVGDPINHKLTKEEFEKISNKEFFKITEND